RSGERKRSLQWENRCRLLVTDARFDRVSMISGLFRNCGSTPHGSPALRSSTRNRSSPQRNSNGSSPGGGYRGDACFLCGAKKGSSGCTKKLQNALCRDFCVKTGPATAVSHRLFHSGCAFGTCPTMATNLFITNSYSPRCFH